MKNKEMHLLSIVITVPFILCFANLLMVYGISPVLYQVRNMFIAVEVGAILLGMFYYRDALKFSKSNLLFVYALLMGGYILCVQLLNSDEVAISMNSLLNSMFVFLIIMAGIVYAKVGSGDVVEKLTIIARFFFWICCGIFLYGYIVKPPTSSPYSIMHAQYVNSIYYLLCALPIALLNRKQRWLFLMATVIAVIASGKQAAILALGAFILVYILTDRRQHPYSNKVVVCIITITVVALLMSFLYALVFGQLGIRIWPYFEAIWEDGGNGRMDIYSELFSLISKSNCCEILFGHGGYGSVARNIGISAHNDFLEILFDYGFVGIVLYFFVIGAVIRIFQMLSANRRPEASAFGGMISIFLVISMLSHLVFILKYFMITGIFWGVLSGRCEDKKWLLEF